MAESKLLEEDKDAWFFESLKRYENLYMFDMEFPVEAMEVIDDTSICLSGIQAYSRKCEFLQLSIPPKLLPKDMEEGLCKDRDFKIISGGYASTKIKQIKSMKIVKDFVAARQEGKNGVTLIKLGNDDHAVIQEKGIFSIPTENVEATGLGLGPIDTFSGRLVAGSFDGKSIHEWTFSASEERLNSSNQYTIPEDGLWGSLVKIKFWDDNSVTFITNKGVVCLKDLREGNNPKPTITFHATKSFLMDASSSSSSSTQNIVFSFDSLVEKNRIGVVDSCGGYESVDLRFVETGRERVILPGCAAASCVLVDRFNIEYEPAIKKKEDSNITSKFIVTGMNEDSVQVYQESRENNTSPDEKSQKLNSLEVGPVFLHDGHSKPVSHALWHPHSERLLFSTSIDAVLHAWQYIEK